MSWISKYAVPFLLGLSATLHLAFLAYPRQVVFDEVHFGKFISAYCCTHERFFDIHPPHAKLLIAAAVSMTGYKGDFSFESIGQPYGNVPVAAFRIVPAFMGMILPLICFTLLRQLGVSRLGALFGGLIVLFDNALLLQTRIIALDGMLLVATFGALSVYLWARQQVGKKRAWGFIVVGILCGLAVGSKFTGLAATAIVGAFMLLDVVRKKARFLQAVQDGLLVLICAAVVYFGGWYIHFALLPNAGSGDAWGVPTGNFFSDVTTLQKSMLDANYNLTAGHPYSSQWWSWPLMQRPVFYWSGPHAAMYFLGNPLVWWGAFVCFIAALITIGLDMGNQGKSRLGMAGYGLIIGYVISFLPLVRVPRALFLYHYATPLLFSLLLGVLWLDKVWLAKKHDAGKFRFYGIAAMCVMIVFGCFSPYTFGFPVDSNWATALYWLPGWR